MQCALHFRYMSVQAISIVGFQREEIWADLFPLKEIKKVRAILEYFRCLIGNTARPGHTVAQGQTVTCCECGLRKT
jgi:hypothetical protein